jgi:hypothetical protein
LIADSFLGLLFFLENLKNCHVALIFLCLDLLNGFKLMAFMLPEDSAFRANLFMVDNANDLQRLLM